MARVPLMLGLFIACYNIFALKKLILFSDAMTAKQLGILAPNLSLLEDGLTFVIKLLTEELKYTSFSMNHCQNKDI